MAIKNKLLLLSVAIPAVGIADDRPNILWVVSEDNTTYLGCYGDPYAVTPNIDELAQNGVRYTNAFATAPVSAPARSTVITGLYPTSMGTQNMRSQYPIPEYIRAYVEYLREAGYYCANNSKTDYNSASCTTDSWDDSSKEAWWSNRDEGQPFFQVCNFESSHESSIFSRNNDSDVVIDPDDIVLPPYLPDTPGNREDRAYYYSKLAVMDSQIGEVFERLEEDGLADNTIIFYFGDNGGVLARSKRFLYDQGLRVPLVIHFPEKYKHLAPAEDGQAIDRLVSFVDFAPTMLNMLGIDIPSHMQGQPFLGDNQQQPRDYVYAFRNRMDERYDFSRVVQGKRYKYIRNYMPHRPWGQHINFLFRAKGMQEWKAAYDNGECNEIQARFFETKAAEELYDLETDPFEINNLAENSEYTWLLETMRSEHKKWIEEYPDSGFLTEYEMVKRSKQTTIYDLIRQESLPYERVCETADIATLADPSSFDELVERLDDQEASIRYWATVGMILQPEKAAGVKDKLKTMILNDESTIVRLSAAEALFDIGYKEEAIADIRTIIHQDSDEHARVYAYNILDIFGDCTDDLKKEVVRLYKDDNDSGYDQRIITYWHGKFKD